MSNSEERFIQLLDKYRNNTLSFREYQEFLELAGDPALQAIIDRQAGDDWKASEEIIRRMPAGNVQRRPVRIIRLLAASAASIALLVAALLFWPAQSPVSESLTYQTGYGETRSILLPDSSTVLLNANTRLVWNTGWEKKGRRDMTLEGEAFFEVKKVNGMEFVVESDNVKVKVLGTVFNFRSRRGLAHVFLESGKVNLEVPALGRPEVPMMPGDAIHYDNEKKDLVIETASSLDRSASWVEGMLEFQDESLGTILDHLEELYGKKFKAENKALLEKRMDLSLPYSNWELIRKALELSLHVKFTEKQDTLFVN